MSFVASVRNHIDALVHPSARGDALTAARHRAFIAPRLIGSTAALAALPLYLVARGVPGVLEVVVLGWLVAPILLAYFLSRTGRFEAAHGLSALALTGLVTAIAWRTGGIASFAAVWLAAVPLEAALSVSRRVIALACAAALAAAGLLAALTAADLLPPPEADAGAALATLAVISAALYAGVIALGVEALARINVSLRHAEEDRYRLLARNMTDAISRHGRNGAVLFISPAIEQLVGVPAHELLGHGLFGRIHVTDRPAYLTALADAARHGEERSVAFRVRREGGAAGPDSALIWIEMRCRPVDRAGDRSGDAQPRDVVAVLRDIGERKAQEEALEATRIALEKANAGKSRFLATMSHELRTPLNAIIGFSDMLMKADNYRLDAAQRDEYARLIHESGSHLLSVVNGILDMSKMDSGNFEIEPESFAPAPVISGCCDLLGLKAREAGVDIRLRLPPALPDIVADKRALNQILINLISNAVKFSDRGGRITVSAVREGGSLVLTVEDTGVGIGKDDLPRLGEAFFQARASYDRRHDGSGLGLSIVKGLVKLHGGDMTIASRLGEGTRVSVRLPLDCDGRTRAAKPIPLAAARAEDNTLTTMQARKRA